MSARGGANVILVVTDDMRYDGLWTMPRLMQLAERGVVFNRFFVTTPLCCPSRATFLTGLYASSHGVRANSPPQGGVEAFNDSSTLGTWAQARGVRTGLVGRYLNGYASLDIPPGWDEWFVLWQANEEYGSYYDYRVNDNGRRRYYGSKEEMYSTRVLGQQALEFLAAERERPFFLQVTPRAPHGPATPDHVDAGTYTELRWPLPPSYNELDVSDKPSWIAKSRVLPEKYLEDIEVYRRRQFEALLSVDRLIGSLIDELRDDGRLDRTWIIFSSDNGLTLGEHRRDARKSCPYEECVRVPLVVIPPPGYNGPPTSDHLVANIDIAPTIAEILGTEPDRQVDGRSLLPLLENPDSSWREAVLIELLKDEDERGYEGVRTADRKYVRYFNGEEELYDEVADPYELENLASHPAWREEKLRLGQLIDELRATALR